MHLESSGKRLLIFIVAYNAEKTITSVLNRIPESLRTRQVEVLVIDDSSRDGTFAAGLETESPNPEFKISVLRNPENQGYGGNQKLGYRYAIDHGFDYVALVHGDGQYAPEKLPALVEPLLAGRADAVFGSRMVRKEDALKGGMPLYKWVGNQVLTTFQNIMLGTRLSEFHTGYRIYSTDALGKIPFERNSNDFHFDTDIIIQLVYAGLRIEEVPIPTFYGDEVCHVNGWKYAWDVTCSMLRAKLHLKNLMYDRKFDVGPVEETYTLKLGFRSSHTVALECVMQGAAVLDIGCGRGHVTERMAAIALQVTGLDQYPNTGPAPANVRYLGWNIDHEPCPVDVAAYDQVFLLDVIEHLRDPEVFMENLRAAAQHRRPEIVITTANVAFIVTRLMLLVGQFNYGRKGILDRTHTRLFTFRSLRELLEQTGYVVLETRGIPAPIPLAAGDTVLSRFLMAVNELGIRLLRGLFSYQIFMRAQARPTVAALLSRTLETSARLREEHFAAKADAQEPNIT
jgi:glycosyltransferase involved in cell wall biosynthesis